MVVKQFKDGGRPPFLKIDISPYLSEKSSDFDEILYTAADFELDERHVIKNEKKVALDRLRVRQNVFLVIIIFVAIIISSSSNNCSNGINNTISNTTSPLQE